jgi:hypothetical protein
MKFYEFKQNNSGGSFDVNDKLTNHVIIQANSESEAIQKAENMGVYFDGCEKGMDCECCGDRWYLPSKIEGDYQYGSFSKDEAESIVTKYGGSVVPTKYNSPYRKEDRVDILFSIESYAQYMADNYGWCSPDVRIFYSNGEVKEFYTNKEKTSKRR